MRRVRPRPIALHVRPALTYLFPLVIDGFIAYGVRALLVLRNAPFRARLYVWLLFASATTASVWANALHAVRLNQQTHAAGLRLGDNTVGLLSTIAPLALAGAVHLHILITARRRRRRPPAPATSLANTSLRPQYAPSRRSSTPARMRHPGQRIQSGPPDRQAAQRGTRRTPRPGARPVFAAHESPTRAQVREAVRSAGHSLSEDRLTQVMATLRPDQDGH
ncbi:hypothetical protein [Streptomyces sp. NPDC088725]|uniref:hypothetical protein n=1 Tax=Streptomyces sp. NPDC088725 TaxID=3365873 RepID=UPI003804F58E